MFGLKRFNAVVQAVKQQAGYTSAILRTSLGHEAELAVSEAPSRAHAALNNSAAAFGALSDTGPGVGAELSTVLFKALGAAVRSKPPHRGYKKPCKGMRDTGKCGYRGRSGTQGCNYSHGLPVWIHTLVDSWVADPKEWSVKDKLIAAVAKYCDGVSHSPYWMGFLSVLLRQTETMHSLQQLERMLRLLGTIEGVINSGDTVDLERLRGNDRDSSATDVTFVPPKPLPKHCSQSQSQSRFKSFNSFDALSSDDSDSAAPAPSVRSAPKVKSVTTPAPDATLNCNAETFVPRPTPKAAHRRSSRVSSVSSQLSRKVADSLLAHNGLHGNERGRSRHRIGPVADTGAEEDFIGTRDAPDAINVRSIQPLGVITGNGRTSVDAAGTLPGFAGVMHDGKLLPGSQESLNSVGRTCEQHGCGYTVDPGNAGARYWHPCHPSEDIECEKDGRIFRLPNLPDGTVSWLIGLDGLESDPMARACNVFSSTPDWFRDHCRKGHPYDDRCEHCLRARMRAKQHKRQHQRKFDHGGYTTSADFTGRQAPDIDGHTVALVCCVHGFDDDTDSHCDEAAYGFVALLVQRTAKATALALDLFDSELQRLGKVKDRCIVRFHTDVDASFLGEVQRQAIRKGWRVTDTGGYNSASNSIVERRIGMLKQTARAVLLTATGGTGYLQELWGHSLIFANNCVNRNDWSKKLAPHTQLHGTKYVWGKHEHCFGEYVLWHLNKENKDHDYREPGQQGIWVRPEPGSTDSAVIVPIVWDSDQDCWLLKPTVIATRFTVVTGIFPLKMCPPIGNDGSNFDDFVDAVYDPLMSTLTDDGMLAVDQGDQCSTPCASDCESDGDATKAECEYEVEKILNRKETKGVVHYLVKWKGWSRKHNSWEPKSNLTNSADLIQEFEAARDAHVARVAFAALEPSTVYNLDYGGDEDVLFGHTCRAFAAALREPSGRSDMAAESRRAVEHLMRRQKVQGDADDWIPGYEAEMEKVTRLRLRELDPAEAAKVRANKLVPRLRMILEAKRDGRKKGRLILQGFLEPHSWDRGQSNDSPVVGMATIRCLLASLRKGDSVSARDISVAFLQSHPYTADEPSRYVSYKAYSDSIERVYELLGPLYGQRSASRRWYETIAGWLTADVEKGGAGFVQGKNEPCLFFHPVSKLKLVLYVDDLLLVGDRGAADVFHSSLATRFSCRDPPEFLSPDNDLEFLGFTVSEERRDEERYVYMDQQDALQQFLDEFQHDKLQPKDSPMPSKSLFHSDPAPLSDNGSALYRHAVGTLIYFSRTTRFDIAFAVSRLGSKMCSPDGGAFKALMHLLGYMSRTIHFRIGGTVRDDCEYSFYCDSDHAGDRKSTTRSQTGYIAFLNSFPIDWCSRRQPETSVSPAQAEIYAMQEAVQGFKLLLWVSEEMGLAVSWPFTIKTDSSQARSFQHSTCPSTKLRGMIDLRNSSVCEMRDKGVVNSVHIPRQVNIADILTHCLSREPFNTHLKRAQNLHDYNSRGACVYVELLLVQLSHEE